MVAVLFSDDVMLRPEGNGHVGFQESVPHASALRQVVPSIEY